MGRDPYHVLGVAPGASQDEIRTAYRSAARRLHPDRAGDDPRAADHMAELNAAYAALQQRTSRMPMSATPADPPPARPVAPVVAARFPWRLVAGIAVVGSLVVIAGALFATPEDPERPDGVLQIGSCVRVDGAGFAIEEPCTSDGARFVVRAIVPTDSGCGAGDNGYLDRLGLGRVCVNQVP